MKIDPVLAMWTPVDTYTPGSLPPAIQGNGWKKRNIEDKIKDNTIIISRLREIGGLNFTWVFNFINLKDKTIEIKNNNPIRFIKENIPRCARINPIKEDIIMLTQMCKNMEESNLIESFR